MKKPPKSWIAWVGFVNGKPFVQHVSDKYCDQLPNGKFPESHELQVFVRRSDAIIRYGDARRVRITEEPKP